MTAHPSNWTNDLSPVIDEIKTQIFGESQIDRASENAIRQELKLAPHIDSDSETIRYVQLPNLVHFNLRNLIDKNDNIIKLSFVRCVCGGSVIGKNISSENPIYECTRCHKIIESLPEKEIDPETSKLLNNIAKKCPICSTYIQKSEGCDHMFCTNCKNGFNWNDLSNLKNRDNTNPLFHEHRHGNSSNLRTLLDDYMHPADRKYDPIDWFCHELYVDMTKTENKLKEHRESIEFVYDKFLNDDDMALKFTNELNIYKMRVKFIQKTFDTIIADAFRLISAGNYEDLRQNQRKLVNDALSKYRENTAIIDTLNESLNLYIDCAIEKALRLSRGVEEQHYEIPEDMVQNAAQMEEEILAQISKRFDEIESKTMVIGGHRISIVRS